MVKRRYFRIFFLPNYFFFLFSSLSGLSPFAGENDIETLKNVKACDWDFDEESFAIVSDEGKDFIRRLLLKNKEYVFFFLYIYNVRLKYRYIVLQF